MRTFSTAGCFVLALLTPVAGRAQSYENDYEQVAKEVAFRERLKYYDILTADNADAVDLCVQSGIVANAYLEAGDRDAYDTWKGTEKRKCKEAGVR